MRNKILAISVVLAMFVTAELAASRSRPAPAPTPTSSGPASAPKSATAIYVHGFRFGLTTETPACHLKTSCGYWGKTDTTGRAIRIVGYDGRYNPLVHGSTRGVVRLLDALNRYCRRDQGKSCVIVNHSMGGLVTGYTIANYNRSNTYNIHYVSSLVSAEGGSELANIGNPILRTLSAFTFGISDLLLKFPNAVQALTTSYTRSAYDHNRNNGVSFYHIAGDTPKWYINWIFNGDHDSVVAMHTTCGYRVVEDFTRCGGQSITTGWLWWKKTTNHSPHTGHKSHPKHSRYGVGTGHTDFPDKGQFTGASL